MPLVKEELFPTNIQSICTGSPDQLFDMNFADQHSVGDAEHCRPTSVGNLVLWCSATAVAAGQVGSRNKRKKKKGGPPGQVVQQPQFTQQSDQFMQPHVVVSAGVPAGAVESVTPIPEAAAVFDAPASSEPALVADVVQGKGKKSGKCWKCAVNSHATKDCTVQHYCLVCDNFKHPYFEMSVTTPSKAFVLCYRRRD
jgi:hypothetical protein